MSSRFAFLFGTALVTTLSTVPAMAQEAPQASSDAVGGNDIVVTAQRREQSLQDTPIAVSAFNSAMLEDRAVNSVIALASNTPGLYLSQGTASPSTLQIAMRGALEQSGGSVTSESPVAIYIDDVYQSRLSAADYDLADIERVEVLRGPQGTLYGRNSMTGAMKLVTRQPNGDNWANFDISYARFDEVKAKASVGAALTGNLALAASGFYDNRDKGWQYNVFTREDVTKFRRYGGQVALGLTNVDRVEAVVTARYAKSTSDGQHFLPINDTPPYNPALGFYQTRTPLPAIGNNEQYSFSGRFGYDLTDTITVRSITAYQHLDEHWALDFAGGYVAPGSNADPIPGFYRDSLGKQNQFTQELQVLANSADDRLHVIAGFFYFREHARQDTNDIFTGFPLPPSSIETKSRSYAGYGQADYEIIPGLTASAGIRYTHDIKSFFGTTPDSAGTIYALNYGIKANVWTPKFNLQWKWSDTGMVYATAARGYRAAGFNSLNSGEPAGFGRPYAPEFAWSYEIGAKVDLLDRALQLNLAAYHESLTDLQTLALGNVAGSYLTQNAAKAKVQGIELETTLRPVQGISFFGNLTYTYDKYQELDPGSQAAQAGAEHLPLISRWQYQVGGTADLPIGDSTVTLAADYSYRTSYNSLVSLSQASENPAIGRANASVTYKLPGDHIQFYAQASNLFNSKDWFASAEFVPGLFGYKIPLEPRVWRVGFRYKM
ncbi:TonB-dependent receptor [Novosphingobium resinovorum]|uniref:TonB-dependent siderophore receptor n=1 Tax=Novosphingobium resinovorum TaxID=158500 RepID=A0A031JUF8_9SPHN|nr:MULTISPECIES: TonB-dependent receptor [Novosphingobium]EZP80529.1 TonB-dependent siderophore receptor precursor [Novosphingobium resinovorum]MBF7013551.1 TonB-dependent receptor [Novosphingobium sp. HR1a]WJM25701.1 TonB-dependent receptor [Novosphingobium resinovorum]